MACHVSRERWNSLCDVSKCQPFACNWLGRWHGNFSPFSIFGQFWSMVIAPLSAKRERRTLDSFATEKWPYLWLVNWFLFCWICHFGLFMPLLLAGRHHKSASSCSLSSCACFSWCTLTVVATAHPMDNCTFSLTRKSLDVRVNNLTHWITNEITTGPIN